MSWRQSGRMALLVLSRQVGETTVIGRDIEVKVVEIRGGKVKLGIEAPRQVPVDRLEIADRKGLHRRPKGGGDAAQDGS
jgi:carbon storage regulator